MPIPQISYKTVLDSVKAYIKQICGNVDSNYSSLHNNFKTNTVVRVSTLTTSYKVNVTTRPSVTSKDPTTTKTTYNSKVTSGISQVAGSKVDSDLDNYFGNLGLTTARALYNIDDKSYYIFVANIINFCVQRIQIAVSTMPTTKDTTASSSKGTTSWSFNVNSNNMAKPVYISGSTTGGYTMSPSANATTYTLDFNSSSEMLTSIIKAIQGATYKTALVKHAIQ